MSNSKVKIKKVEGFYVEISEGLPDFQDEDNAFENSLSVQNQSSMGVAEGDELVGGISEKIREKTVDIKQTITNICGYIKEAFEEANHPDEITVTFGIKLVGEQGIPLVTRGSAEATIGVEAKWKKEANQ